MKIDINEMDFESLTVSLFSEFCTGEDESSGCLIETPALTLQGSMKHLSLRVFRCVKFEY
jgi:hypothetical protein